MGSKLSNSAVMAIGDLLDSIHRFRSAERGAIHGQAQAIREQGEPFPYAYVLEQGSFPGQIKVKLHYQIPTDNGSVPVDEVIMLKSSQPGFGGERWWLTCPACRNRKAKLYLRPGTDRFSCPNCQT
jgi:hypothetical protein